MGSPVRVLHVVVNMNRGGAETLIMNLYRNIDRSKIQFDFLTCKEGVFDQEILDLGGKIHRIPYITDGGHFHYIKNLKQFFKENNHYRIVHSHMDKMSGFVLNAALKAGIPIRIAHSHSTQSEGSVTEKVYKSYAGSYIFGSASHLLACSTEAAKWLFSKQSMNAIILKNGIDVEKFKFSPSIRSQVRNQLQIDDETFVIGHVGRFYETKNHSFLIDIFANVIRYQSNSKLILAGDGPLRKKIEGKVEELGLVDKVIFTGVYDKINELLQSFDIFVFPSIFEGFGIAVLEAQGSGLPCIISDTMSDEVDLGINLIDTLSLENKDLWVEKVVNLYNIKNDRKNNCQAIIKRGYDITSIAKSVSDFYMKVAR